ncbi:hypothetical protein EDB81DRAFT_839495 [Dactylonectria macrodidyma]|uniref:DUF7924 domain-containing protein n=1 Tax=Dactylonectria macrodidyma TaxID=307937 RepID=A0A9P9FGK2_9HYPO|nr:hypothetical protein EDB81DRAFT_839495 [Dactylonectria macrodidyma]
MDSSRNAENGFVAPLVAPPLYRLLNLASNNIFLRPSRDPLPDRVAELLILVRRSRDSAEITHDQVRQNQALENLDGQVKEEAVAAFFQKFVLPATDGPGCLQGDAKQPMVGCTVPNTVTDFHVSRPIPDMLYGYRLEKAFPDQWVQLMPLVREVAANNLAHPSLYPFFNIKFKGETGSMWVATNQCLGASSSCVNIAEDLNTRLKQCGSNKVIDSTVFSLTTNGSEARLYVSWKHDEVNYYTTTIRRFLLQESDQYIELCNIIHNIIDWGCGKRLDEIRESMDILLAADLDEMTTLSKFTAVTHHTACN